MQPTKTANIDPPLYDSGSSIEVQQLSIGSKSVHGKV